MKPYSFFPHGKRAYLFNVVVLLSAVGLMLLTIGDHLHRNSPACLGLLGAGHPASFLCDYSSGETPIFDSVSSDGRIDKVDFPYLSPEGFIVDFLFYTALILLVWFLVTYAIYLARRHP